MSKSNEYTRYSLTRKERLILIEDVLMESPDIEFSERSKEARRIYGWIETFSDWAFRERLDEIRERIIKKRELP